MSVRTSCAVQSLLLGILGPIAYAQGAVMDGWVRWMANGLLLLAVSMTAAKTGPNSIACSAYLSIEKANPIHGRGHGSVVSC